MSDSPPRLVAVPGEPEADAGASSAPSRRVRSLLLWVLAGAFAVSALGWLFQARETRELAQSLEATRTALVRAQAELRAYDQHLSRVDDQVGLLRERLDALQALLEEGPGRSPEP